MVDSHRLRLTLFGVLIIGLFAALFSRLWYLQIVTEEQFQVQASQNLFRTVATQAPRGRILDAGGNVLVGNRVTNIVEVDKSELYEQLPEASRRSELAEELAREISRTGRLIKAQAIEDAFNDQKYGPFDQIPIATDVNEKFAILLGERLEDFPGVSVGTALVREYPYAELAAHVLGTVGPITEQELLTRKNNPKTYSRNDEIGKTGVESTFEDTLRGVPGKIVKEVDARNEVVAVEVISEPQPGQDIVLTIDINLQAVVERELRKGIEEARKREVEEFIAKDRVYIGTGEQFLAPAGAMVLIDPEGGDVLAMASYPTFDPQLFIGGISALEFDKLRAEKAFAPLLNRAIQGAYSPGSTFKPFSAYVGMDTGMLGPRGFLDVNEFTEDEGVYRIPNCDTDDCVFQNAGRKAYGDVDLRKALSVSSDVYFYKLAYQFDARRGFSSTSIQDGVKKFGLGRATGIALPFENAGRMPDPEQRRAQHEAEPEIFPDPTWRAGDTLNTSIGQGDVALTPLQMANAYAALANGGTVYAPQIVSQILDPVTDEPVVKFSPRIIDELYMPDEIRNPLIDGLRGVLVELTEDQAGTGFEAFEGFPLDRFPVAAKTGTIETEGKQDSSAFAAFGPVNAPRYSAFAYVEQGGFGGKTSGPIVRNVLEAIANDQIGVVPTVAEVRDYYRQFVVSDDAEEGDELPVPSGDVAEDIVRGLPVQVDEDAGLIERPDADDPEQEPTEPVEDASVDERPVDDAPVEEAPGADPTAPPEATVPPTATVPPEPTPVPSAEEVGSRGSRGSDGDGTDPDAGGDGQ